MNEERTRVFSHITRTRFLHIEDALERGKLRFFIGSFERGRGALATAYAFLDVEEARVVLNDLSWGRPVDLVDFKGGRNDAGRLIARVLKISSERRAVGQRAMSSEEKAEGRVWIQVTNGPGEELDGGAIKLAGQPSAEISMPLTVFEGRKLGFACLGYMQAWEIARMMGEGWVVSGK
jgi:hypothetical protein